MSAVIITSAVAVPSSAEPPNSTDHGIPEETFHKLWSGDRDDAASNEHHSDKSAIEQLADGTDVPLDTPPGAVEQWNHGDHQEFPATNSSVSIHPTDSDLTGERFIQDAYTEVFAVQPSTRARLSPSQQPLYVAPRGTVLGTVDYRVAVPPDDTSGDRRVFWSLESHQIEDVRLLVDGDQQTTANGTHTPSPAYELDGDAGLEHELTLEVDISVRLRKEVRACAAHDVDWDCSDWRRSVVYPTEELTVRDSLDVTEYDLSVSGFTARYPNGDFGLVVYKNQPWLGYELPNGDVRGVWRFYSARDRDWDTLVYSSASGQQTVDSPLHPLQVNAYPIETGPTPSPRRNVTILDVYGTSTKPPALPPNVTLDALEEPYTASYGIATRAATNERVETIRAWGLVRGVRVERPADEFPSIQIHESNLTLTTVNQTADTTRVRVRLRDASTGGPIDTTQRDGYILVNGRRLNTTANGILTTTVERSPDGVSAQFEPGHWWRNPVGYTSDSDTVLVQGTVLRVISMLFGIGVPVSLFLLAVFIIDRITAWRIWPPWKQL